MPALQAMNKEKKTSLIKGYSDVLKFKSKPTFGITLGQSPWSTVVFATQLHAEISRKKSLVHIKIILKVN